MPEMKSPGAVSVENLQRALDALGAQLIALNARLAKIEEGGSAARAAVRSPAESAAQPGSAQAMSQAEAAHVAQRAGAESGVAAPNAAELGQVPDEFSEELLLVLSAAVAAYFGKRPHIRAVRLLGSSAWAQQGRVFVQASHQLNVPHEA